MNSQRLLERFLRYVKLDTMARPDSSTVPSSEGQLVLGKMLVGELLEMGLSDAAQDEHGIVMATVPHSGAPQAPMIVWNAHVDTSPETTGKNVRPQVWQNYQGGDITLPGAKDRVIRLKDNPELAALKGKTLITTDGTTLLGADDKAGLAVIMAAAHHLQEHPEIVHGPICVCFTCDEEIGHGVDHVDMQKLGGVAGYTLDGEGADHIDVETFSADRADVLFRGVNIHPSIAKGRMVNAVRMAAWFIDQLPRTERSPESTAERQGFLHPYQLEAGVEQATLRVLLRDFETPGLAVHRQFIEKIAAECRQRFPGSQVEVTIVEQYRNMADGLANEPRAVALAEKALRQLGREPKLSIIRGGTDGAQFTAKGLPMPNLSTGEHNPHSPLEWTCLEEMVAAATMLVTLAELWGKEVG